MVSIVLLLSLLLKQIKHEKLGKQQRVVNPSFCFKMLDGYFIWPKFTSEVYTKYR